MDGLEVHHPSQKDIASQKELAPSTEKIFERDPAQSDTADEPGPKNERRICGLPIVTFWVIVGIVIAVVTAGIVVGAVVGTRHSHSASTSSNVPTTPSSTPTKSKRPSSPTSLTSPTARSTTSLSSSANLPPPTNTGWTTVVDVVTFADSPSGTTVLSTITTAIPSTVGADVSTKTLSTVLPVGTAECPAADGTTYTSNKDNHTQVFLKSCNGFVPTLDYFYYYNSANTMDGCLDFCASWNSPQNLTCLAAGYGWTSTVGYYCYLFHAIGPVVPQGYSEFGVLVAFDPSMS